MAAAPEGRFVSGGTRTFRSLPDPSDDEIVRDLDAAIRDLDAAIRIAARAHLASERSEAVAALERVRDRLRAHDEDAYEQMGYDDIFAAELAALAPEGTA